MDDIIVYLSRAADRFLNNFHIIYKLKLLRKTPSSMLMARKHLLDKYCTILNSVASKTNEVKILNLELFLFQGSGGLSAYEKQAIVDSHNRLRQSVALGQVSSQPPAANMMEMVSTLCNSAIDALRRENTFYSYSSKRLLIRTTTIHYSFA